MTGLFRLVVLCLALLPSLAVLAETFSTTGTYETTPMLERYRSGGELDDAGRGVRYIPDDELGMYRLVIEDGKAYVDSNAYYGRSRQPSGEMVEFDTRVFAGTSTEESRKALYVMDAEGRIFVIAEEMNHRIPGQPNKIHHSSLSAGRPVAGAGLIEVHDGRIVAIDPNSGHFRPGDEQLGQVARQLERQGLSRKRPGQDGFEVRPHRSRGQAPATPARAVRNPPPARQPQPDAEPPPARQGLPDLADGESGTREVRAKYKATAEQVFDRRQPGLRRVENRASLPRVDDVAPDYATRVERQVAEQTRQLASGRLQNLGESLRDTLAARMRQAVEREVRMVRNAYREWKANLPGLRRNDLNRVSGLTYKAAEVPELQRLLVQLGTAEQLVAFTRAYYDGGWPQVWALAKQEAEMAVYITASVALVATTQTGREIVGFLVPNLSPLFVGLAIKSIATNVVYMSVDYFIHSPQRRRLLADFYPPRESSSSHYDFWTFYRQVYGADLNSDTLYRIHDRWQGFRNLDVNLIEDMAVAVDILVNRYRQWLLDGFPGVRGLEYYKDDPTLWNDLATVLLQDMRISLTKRALQELHAAEVRRMQAELQRTEVELRTAPEPLPPPVIAFVQEPVLPLVAEAGQSLDIDVAYLIFGLPDETLDAELTIRLLDENEQVETERGFSRVLRYDRDTAVRAHEINASVQPRRSGPKTLRLDIHLDGEQRTSLSYPLHVGDAEDEEAGEASPVVPDTEAEIARIAAGIEDAVALCGTVAELNHEANALRQDATAWLQAARSLESRFQQARQQGEEVRNRAIVARNAAEQLIRTKQDADQQALALCQQLPTVQATDDPMALRELLKRLDADQQALHALRTGADSTHQDAHRAADEARQALDRVRAFRTETDRTQPALQGLRARLQALQQALPALQSAATGARTAMDELDVQRQRAQDAIAVERTRSGAASNALISAWQDIAAYAAERKASLADCVSGLDTLTAAVQDVRTAIGEDSGLPSPIREAAALVQQTEQAEADARSAADVTDVWHEGLLSITNQADDCVELARREAERTLFLASQQAIVECRFDAAGELMSHLPAGPRAQELHRQHGELEQREREARALYRQARQSYADCSAGRALAQLEQARVLSPCETTRRVLQTRITAAREAAERQQHTRQLFRQAKAAFAQCDYQQADRILDQALQNARCERHRNTLRQAGSRLEQARERERRTRSLFAEATGAYRNCRFEEAVSGLQAALSNTRCARYREQLDQALDKVQAAAQQEETPRALYRQANAAYRSCRLDIALGHLDQALELSRCEANRQQLSVARTRVLERQRRETEARRLVGRADALLARDDRTGALRDLNAALGYTQCEAPRQAIASRIAALGEEEDTPDSDTETMDASDTESEPFAVVFDLHFPTPTELPGWLKQSPPPDADEAARARFLEQQLQRLEHWLNSLSLADVRIEKMEDSDPLLISVGEGALEAYPRTIFVPGQLFALPLNGTYGGEDRSRVDFTGALLLTVREVHETSAASGVASSSSGRLDGPDGMVMLPQEQGARFDAGPLTAGWSEAHRQQSLELLKSIIPAMFLAVGGVLPDCFVATAVYADPRASQLTPLRKLRDAYLMQTPGGRALVRAYYRHGPALALKLRDYPRLRAALRAGLDRLAGWLEQADLQSPPNRYWLGLVTDTAAVLIPLLLRDDAPDATWRFWLAQQRRAWLGRSP